MKSTKDDYKGMNDKGQIFKFAAGLQLPLTKEGEKHLLQIVDDEQFMHISDPIKAKDKDSKVNGLRIVSLLGTVITAGDNKKHDFTQVKKSSLGSYGGIGCTNESVLDAVSQNMEIQFSVVKGKNGSSYANFDVPTEVAPNKAKAEKKGKKKAKKAKA